MTRPSAPPLRASWRQLPQNGGATFDLLWVAHLVRRTGAVLERWGCTQGDSLHPQSHHSSTLWQPHRQSTVESLNAAGQDGGTS